MRSLNLRSPAKLNLCLKVINKRPDGYHNLETLFERVNLFDSIRIKLHKKDGIDLHCKPAILPKGPGNLAYRAADFLKKKYKISEGVEIFLDKQIPIAAGLGGGSSNAATVFAGLNQLWKLAIPKTELMSLGGILGSDVPFFLNQSSWAIGTERGDVIRPVPIAIKMWHVLIVPRIKMYSREVFTRANLQLTKNNADVNILIRALYNNDINKAGKALFNDLEASILGLCPRLVQVKKRLEKFALNGVSFSGSGPAVFGITADRAEAAAAGRILSKRYSRVYLVKTY